MLVGSAAHSFRACPKNTAHQSTAPIPIGISSHQRAMKEGYGGLLMLVGVGRVSHENGISA